MTLTIEQIAEAFEDECTGFSHWAIAERFGVPVWQLAMMMNAAEMFGFLAWDLDTAWLQIENRSDWEAA